ncbi:hypothetical protein [Psychrosphaera aestuarii]|uniref:hypothetical protein n=1 Tax=Psychrosphaera aestuarii TaxID=1266052 RepID=UPI001B31F9EA|nr:hypothetical protein [Psychrosphaera aestuarii]
MKKYQLVSPLSEIVDQAVYEKWLARKARAHVKRDRERGNDSATVAEYKVEIHRAVIESDGLDAYTLEKLDWSLLSKYDNEQSKLHGRNYKKLFAMLPSVDHVDDGLGKANFKICSWQTNDAKNDLAYSEFVELCKKVVRVATNKPIKRDC